MGGYLKKELLMDKGLSLEIWGDTAFFNNYETWRKSLNEKLKPFKTKRGNKMQLGNKAKVNAIKASEAKKTGLNLKSNKGIIDKKSEVTLQKLVEVEELKKMVKSQSILIEGLKGDIAEQQKDIIRFSSAINNLQKIIEENNKLIVNLSLKVKTSEFKTELPVNKTKPEAKTKPSNNSQYPINLETITLNEFYELFLKESDISFYGSKKPTYPETFESFITHIDNKTIESMNDSIRQYWGEYKKQNKNNEEKKYLFSPAAIPLAVKAMGRLLFGIEIEDFKDKKPIYTGMITGNTSNEDDTNDSQGLNLGKNYRVKVDKNYLVTVFKTDMHTINEVLSHAEKGIELTPDDKKDIRSFIIDNSEYAMNEVNKKAWQELFNHYHEICQENWYE